MQDDTDMLRVTLLGTGIPNPHINAFGTSTMIEAGDQRVLIDCGRGAVIRMAQAGFPVGHTDTVILSHYHSDHYAGIFDLLMTGTIQQPFANRGGPLHVYGPPGIEDIAAGAWQASGPDRAIRVADSEIDPEHMRMVPHVYTSEGTVFDRDGLKIIAIEVDHGDFIKPAYAFRVEYRGHVFVHSHDTRYNENLIAQAHGADVFVHEIAAGTPETFAKNPRAKIAIDHHANPQEVGRVFAQTKPRLAMLTHIALLPPDPMPISRMVAELADEYDGLVLVAEDLMTIEIGRNVTVVPYRYGGRP
ncbi:MBL fold metallo-hydrolase [Chachezhania sediminis]|uniref:MBL fold metallo-hydrolase n=1 Tax=Chachezhania sediminis TaxID=2599291 RepID=UPI00131D013F|nr:MBL fold metallo-hydrolase [Chachezhania sediminis]